MSAFEVLLAWTVACVIGTTVLNRQPNFFLADDGPLVMIGCALGIIAMEVWQRGFGF